MASTDGFSSKDAFKTHNKMDDKERKDQRDRTRINRNEPYELEYWSKKFNITAHKLREVIDRIGSEEVKMIEKYLTTHQ